ncbi:hypothetical protein B5C34_02475 [Pacificimonas flava]|uniref:Serine aminopeptidase S33 domain-containing protein n=2 Tax=Pacificimonas TaxID=1960290 RepID=A0A219B3P5_9SPHN|nr:MULTISPECIES: alpha/beta hydrolase [Pacificimonas]MBZ6377914.1 alpha/beta hydrolase [Pacificimonas aurantium]OWV32428.1 hypothetical protein B5C34_02475 [Pacificimonas flava]
MSQTVDTAPSPSPSSAPPRTSLPDGGVERFHPMPDGARLRTMEWPDGEGVPVLFMGGKRDFIERHAEALSRIRERERPLLALDWRDQGLSSRASVPTAHLFDRMETDLSHLMNYAAERIGAPFDALAHSMGAHMLLRVLAFDPAAAKLVRRAVLTGPMMGIGSGGAGRAGRILMRTAAEVMTGLGFGEHRPPGQPAYGPVYRSEERRQRLTGDTARFAESFFHIDSNPRLAAGGATWGWLRAAVRSMRKLRRPGVLERIDTPLLVFLGSEERVVDPDEVRAASTRLPRARLLDIEDGHHELFLDTDEVQQLLWQEIWSFLD